MLKSSGHSTKKNAVFTENCECVQNSVSLFHLHCCKETDSDSIGFLTGGLCILEDTNSIPQAWQEFIMYMESVTRLFFVKNEPVKSQITKRFQTSYTCKYTGCMHIRCYRAHLRNVWHYVLRTQYKKKYTAN